MGIETALMVAAAGATIAGGIGQLNAGIAANKAAKEAAGNELRAGETNAAITRRQGQLFIGKQRASFGAMGMDTVGNALDVIQMSAVENELEAQSILTNSRFQAYDYQVKGRMAAAQGRAGFVSSIGQAAASVMLGMSKSPSQPSGFKVGNIDMPGGLKDGSFKPTYSPSASTTYAATSRYVSGY